MTDKVKITGDNKVDDGILLLSITIREKNFNFLIFLSSIQ